MLSGSRSELLRATEGGRAKKGSNVLNVLGKSGNTEHRKSSQLPHATSTARSKVPIVNTVEKTTKVEKHSVLAECLSLCQLIGECRAQQQKIKSNKGIEMSPLSILSFLVFFPGRSSRAVTKWCRRNPVFCLTIWVAVTFLGFLILTRLYWVTKAAKLGKYFGYSDPPERIKPRISADKLKVSKIGT